MKIGNLEVKYPIIQGGMGLKISLAKLAGNVAKQGGMGVIAGTDLKEEELVNEIKEARKYSEGKGAIGVNIMYAATDFLKLVHVAIKEKIDFITFGAGFSRDIFEIGKETSTPIIPIVSSVKLAKISEKLGAAAIVAEGANAGGHLGTDLDSWEIIKDIKSAVKIPVFGAGGIMTPEDGKRMLDMGADGIQMGTRFLATFESNVDQKYKDLLVNLKENDVTKIMSSVGLHANAIRTPFVEKLLNNNPEAPAACIDCLKKCGKSFCIRTRLYQGREGDIENGVMFAGRDAWKIDSILSVEDVFSQFKVLFE